MRHLSAWIAGGQLSSIRLTRIYLDRIRRHDPTLFSFAWLGPLHGIPYGAKDLYWTLPASPQAGAPSPSPIACRKQTQRSSAASPAPGRLLGKTSVGALAFGDVWYGGDDSQPMEP